MLSRVKISSDVFPPLHRFFFFFPTSQAHILPDVLKFFAANPICLQIFGTVSRKMIKWSSSPWSLNFEIAWLALFPTVWVKIFFPGWVSVHTLYFHQLSCRFVVCLSIWIFFHMSGCLPLKFCQYKKRGKHLTN